MGEYNPLSFKGNIKLPLETEIVFLILLLLINPMTLLL